MDDPIDLQAQVSGERVQLLSPGVGWFTTDMARGQVLDAGQSAGVLQALGPVQHLRVPEGVAGRIVNETSERVRTPVGYGDVLFELEPVESGASGARATNAGAAGTASTASLGAATGTTALVLRSPQSGRFYHRSAPGEAAFVSPGKEVGDGAPVGLIEVMKTFNHVVYRSSASLPARARVKRFVAGDGADVKQGDVLIELEAI